MAQPDLRLSWLWRARRNAEILSVAEHRHSRGWVIGGWFCPIVNAWYPPMIVGDIWKTSRPGTLPTYDLARVPGSRLITWWWVLMVIGNVLDWYIRLFELTFPTVDSLRDAARDGTVATMLRTGAAVLIILVIRRINRWQATR